jgi:hypothetical protein
MTMIWPVVAFAAAGLHDDPRVRSQPPGDRACVVDRVTVHDDHLVQADR